MTGPTREIDGNTWELKLLSTTDGVAMTFTLSSLLGAGLVDAIAAGNLENRANLGVALMLSFAKADAKRAQDAIKKLLWGTKMDGKALFSDDVKNATGVYDDAFRGRLKILGEVLMFAIEKNVGGFGSAFGTPAEDGASEADSTSATSGSSSAP